MGRRTAASAVATGVLLAALVPDASNAEADDVRRPMSSASDRGDVLDSSGRDDGHPSLRPSSLLAVNVVHPHAP